jgi:uncharacterized protein with ATP-grasp and redox domains/guanylate kinase
MPKSLLRIVAVLLVPCLLTDPLTAMASAGPAISISGRHGPPSYFSAEEDQAPNYGWSLGGLPPQFLFTSQALSLSPTSRFDRDTPNGGRLGAFHKLKTFLRARGLNLRAKVHAVAQGDSSWRSESVARELREIKAKSPKVLCLVGPSAAGKSTLRRLLLQRHPDLFILFSRVATRAMRNDETVEREQFISQSEFDHRLAANRFLATRHRHLYSEGIDKFELAKAIHDGRIVLVEGNRNAHEIQRLWPDTQIRRIAILPTTIPSQKTSAYADVLRSWREILTGRLRNRDPYISEDELAQRLKFSLTNPENFAASTDLTVINSPGTSIEDCYQKAIGFIVHEFRDVAEATTKGSGSLVMLETDHRGREHYVILENREKDKARYLRLMEKREAQGKLHERDRLLVEKARAETAPDSDVTRRLIELYFAPDKEVNAIAFRSLEDLRLAHGHRPDKASPIDVGIRRSKTAGKLAPALTTFLLVFGVLAAQNWLSSLCGSGWIGPYWYWFWASLPIIGLAVSAFSLAHKRSHFKWNLENPENVMTPRAERTAQMKALLTVITKPVLPRTSFLHDPAKYVAGPGRYSAQKESDRSRMQNLIGQEMNPSIQAALEALLRREEIHGMAYRLVEEILYAFRKIITGEYEPLRTVKARCRDAALQVLPKLNERLSGKGKREQGEEALAISVAGNQLGMKAFRRFASLTPEEQVPYLQKLRPGLTLSTDHRRRLLDEVMDGVPKKIVYVMDNVVEDVFDLPLLRWLLQQGHDVTIVTKGKEAGNEVTRSDMLDLLATPEVQEFLGRAYVKSRLHVISSGSVTHGTDLRRATSEFEKILEEADVILVKGEGNRGTLVTPAGTTKDIYSLMYAKSPEESDVPVNTGVVEHIPATDPPAAAPKKDLAPRIRRSS